MKKKIEIKHIVFLSPSLVGGGAEKVVFLIAKHLLLDFNKISVIVQDKYYDDSLRAMLVTNNHDEAILQFIPSKSKIQGLLSLSKIITRYKSSAFLLNLRFVAYAPLIRLLQPRANIVARIGNTLTAEFIATKSFLARVKYFIGTYFGLIFSDKIIAQCEYMKEDILAFAPFLKPGKISVIHNACEPDIHDLARLEISHEITEPYILCASSYKPQKRLDFLLKSFSLIANKVPHSLIIAGISDIHKEILFEIIKELSLEERVILLPVVENIYPLISRSDLCVLSSTYEGFSNFLLESVSLSKLTLAMDCPGGNRELSAMTNSLLLSKANTPSEFAGDIINALTLPTANITVLRSELPSFRNMCLQYSDLLLS